MILPLNSDEIKELPLSKLASRMDSIISTSVTERYGNNAVEKSRSFDHKPTVSKILATKHVQKMSEANQRLVCYLAFNCLLQMEYTEFSSAAENHYIYGSTYDEKASWLSPTLQIRHAALQQFGIVSSRISMECFMVLVYFLGTEVRIEAKRSTFRKFKNWLQDATNPFSYFATHILRAYLFDRQYRTPEVHASSRLSGPVLRMQTPTSEGKNRGIELTNIMLNIWQPLLDILNEGKAHSITASSAHSAEEDFEWFKSYLHDDLKTKNSNLKHIFDQMK